MVPGAVVGVAVAELCGSCVAHAHDLNFKRQVHASKGVVAIERHRLALELDHGKDPARLPVGAAGGKLVADRELTIRPESLLGDFEHQRGVDFAVSARCSHLDGALVADLEQDELLFEAGDDLSGAFEEAKGLGSGRGIQHFSCWIAEGIMEGDHALSDLHRGQLFHIQGWPTTKNSVNRHHSRVYSSMTHPPTNRPSKDYTRFRELLLAQEVFPLSYLHKLIGRNTEGFELSLAAWQERHPEAECQSSRLSENGGHRAVTFVLKVKDVDELIEMLKESDQLADLVMVL